MSPTLVQTSMQSQPHLYRAKSIQEHFVTFLSIPRTRLFIILLVQGTVRRMQDAELAMRRAWLNGWARSSGARLGQTG